MVELLPLACERDGGWRLGVGVVESVHGEGGE